MKNIKELATRIVNVIMGRPNKDIWFCEGCGFQKWAWSSEIAIAIKNKCHSGVCFDCYGTFDRPCHLCGTMTRNTGAPTCDGCWEDSEWEEGAFIEDTNSHPDDWMD